MISILLDGDTLIVSPVSDINIVIDKMQCIDDREWDRSLKAWRVPKSAYNTLVALFGVPPQALTSHNNGEPLGDISSTNDFEGLKCTPYPFQIVAANFAINKKRVLIADVMGLGKTISSLSGFTKLKNLDLAAKMLVICPASVKYQWSDEINDKTSLKCMVVEGPSKFSGKTLEIREEKAIAQFTKIDEVDIVIANYETLLNDKMFDCMTKAGFDVMTVDEAHYIKNHTAQRSKLVYKLSIIVTYFMALSGTPLENRPNEIYGVFKAIEPNMFEAYSKFAQKYIKFARYGVIAGYKNLDQLRSHIQPYIIRRTLNDVALQMPEKVYSTKVIEMTDNQYELHTKLYDSIQEDLLQLDLLMTKFGPQLAKLNIYNEAENDNIPEPIKKLKASIMAKYTFLLEVCDSPELIAISESKMAKKLEVKDLSSPKLDALVEIIEQVLEQGDKIIVFTQYNEMLKIIRRRLSREFKHTKVAVISGDVEAKHRNTQRQMFVSDKECGIMLLTDAGNFGLNLQVANYIVMFEPPMKPSTYDQRIGRIVRIGSAHQNAFVINLVMKDGWDQNIFKILDKKREYIRALIDKTDAESVTFNKAADSIQSELGKLVKKIGKKK